MQIRQQYLDFFTQKGHELYSSMPLVPDDASLLFTNAGMVQFKDIFTGNVPIPSIPRATSSQLCIRAGGKHNDLENVGYTARHHTLFEMLGNFSFGNYFKREAIAYAWEFVTQKLGFDKSLLYVTVHESDDEAFEMWCEHIDSSRIKRMGDKDNFWQMGDTGPCGPCSEIYVDQGEKYFHSSEDYFGGEGDRFLEIWNLVFMQYEQKDGVRTPLPKPSIDTGMGLERVVALLEKKINNFDTSLFAPIMEKIQKLTGKRYYHDNDVFENTMNASTKELQEIKATQASFRVIADHVRSVAFLLAQGVNFDKEGRGYVLRRILRRGVRHGYLLGLKKAFLYEIIEVVCDHMGEHYGYLLERKNAIMQQCKNEEERFFETIGLGMELFEIELQQTQKVFNGETAFKLYDTYGFPLDLTQDMLRDKGIEVDLQSFQACMDLQRSRSKESWKGSGDSLKEGDFKSLIDEFGINEFVGYDKYATESRILALLDSNFLRTESLAKGQEGYILLDKTPFYPESGGPVGDRGVLLSSEVVCEHKENNNKHNVLDFKEEQDFDKWICDIHNAKDIHAFMCNKIPLAEISDTQKYFNLNLSKCRANEVLKSGQKVYASVSSERLEIAKHHSATHLLHFALRKILGDHIAQAGSLVQANKLRFDFSHPSALSSVQLKNVESLVNAQILASNTQVCEHMDIQEAKARGAMALFGEKYGDNVRVVSFGDSIELCGGIHVENTAQIGSFYITKESGVSSGVRRIEAVCGRAGYEYGKEAIMLLIKARENLKNQDILSGITKLKDQIAELKMRASKAKQSVKSLQSRMFGNTKLVISKLQGINNEELRELIDNAKNENDSIAVLLLSEVGGRISIVAGVKNAPLHAGEWVKSVAVILGGNGGGREDFASAGAKECVQIDEALRVANEYAQSKLHA